MFGGVTRPLDRAIGLIGAPSSIGIRPYDNGTPRRVDLAPGVLRDLGLAGRLQAHDRGDLIPPAYRDLVRPPGGVRNEAEVESYSRALAARTESVVAAGSFALVLGGDCSVALGGMLGARRAVRGAIGLVYADGHADFGTPAESLSGSVASMCLGMAVGRVESPLARLWDSGPLVAPEHVVLAGRRDIDEPWYGHEALGCSRVLDLPYAAIVDMGHAVAAAAVLERVACRELAGFWVHLDVDVMDPSVMPAVDSPTPDGPGLAELQELLCPIVRHPKALGMDVSIYDPALDHDRSAGARLATFLEGLLTPVREIRGWPRVRY